MAKNCYCDWNLVWWWFWIFGSGSDYVLSKIYGSGSDSDTIKIFRSGSDYQISISAQHCNTHLCICDILNHSKENFVIEIEKISWSRPNPFFFKNVYPNPILIRKNRKYSAGYPVVILFMLTSATLGRDEHGSGLDWTEKIFVVLMWLFWKHQQF